MDISITFSGTQPKYIDVYEQLKLMIIDKTLAFEEKLPSKRTLAKDLNVSIHTIKEAYDQLISEGYIYSKERSGYYVSDYDLDWRKHYHIEKSSKITEKHTQEVKYNFRNGQVDEQAFPLNGWLKIYKRNLVSEIVPNDEWQGNLTLREQVALYIKKAKGISCDVEQIYIYSGTQHQLQEVCKFFGRVDVAIEEPGFKRATAVFKQNNLNLHHIPIDEKGATIPFIPCKLYYITPAHQFPLGGIMPVERRLSLLKWAQEANAYLIEDDYDAEFRYKGKPIPPLAQMDQLQRVIYFGTFSKTLMPSLRISYMILPKSLVGKFNDYFTNQKTTVSRIDQLVVAEFMRRENYSKHIAKMRTLYRKKRQCLIDGIQRFLGPKYEIIGDEAGLHIILKLPNELKEEQAIQLASEVGIAIDPVSTSYQLCSVNQYVMIGYGAIEIELIEEALSILATKWNNQS